MFFSDSVLNLTYNLYRTRDRSAAVSEAEVLPVAAANIPQKQVKVSRWRQLLQK